MSLIATLAAAAEFNEKLGEAVTAVAAKRPNVTLALLALSLWS